MKKYIPFILLVLSACEDEPKVEKQKIKTGPEKTPIHFDLSFDGTKFKRFDLNQLKSNPDLVSMKFKVDSNKSCSIDINYVDTTNEHDLSVQNDSTYQVYLSNVYDELKQKGIDNLDIEFISTCSVHLENGIIYTDK